MSSAKSFHDALFANSSILTSFFSGESGLPIRRAEKSLPKFWLLCCSDAYRDFRGARKGPECGRFRYRSEKIL
jgi:hypothetical protein